MKQVLPAGPLMSLADIAEMHRCTERHARDIIVKLPGFPEVAPSSTPRNRLWLRSEVQEFIYRRPAPAQIPQPARKAA